MTYGGTGERARLIWVPEGGEQGAEMLVEVAPSTLRAGELDVPPGEDAPAGRYVKLSDARSVAINPNDPAHAFLHDDFRSYEKSWSQPLRRLDQEAEVADQVYRKVHDAVERELPSGARPIGPTFTSSHQGPGGTMSVRGVCVLARRAR